MGKIVKLPNTKEVQLGSLTLQLRLGTKEIYNIEERLRQSLMGLFMGGQGDELKLPTLKQVMIVLQGANQISGVKDGDIFDAIDTYLENGHTTMDLISIVQELLNESGFFGKEQEVKKDDDKEMSFDEEVTDFQV